MFFLLIKYLSSTCYGLWGGGKQTLHFSLGVCSMIAKWQMSLCLPAPVANDLREPHRSPLLTVQGSEESKGMESCFCSSPLLLLLLWIHFSPGICRCQIQGPLSGTFPPNYNTHLPLPLMHPRTWQKECGHWLQGEPIKSWSVFRNYHLHATDLLHDCE